MIKTRKLLPLLALLGIAVAAPLVAIGAADSVESGPATASDTTNLPLLVLVNRLELTDEQMSTLHGLLSGILDGREAAKSSIESAQAAFEDEMIAFDGTSEELEGLLEAHRAELEALREAHAGSLDAGLDELKETLTFEQGELLQSMFPALLAERAAGDAGPGAVMGRDAGGAMGQRAMPSFGNAQRPGMGRGGSRSAAGGSSCGPMSVQRGTSRGMRASGGPDLIEQLVEILELKML